MKYIPMAMILMLCGCVSIANVPPSNEEVSEKILRPELDQKTTGTLGNAIVTQGNIIYTPAIKLKQSYQTEWVRNSGVRAFPFTFEKGTTLILTANYNGVPIYTGPAKGGLQGVNGQIIGIHGIGIHPDHNVAYVYLSGGAINETPGRFIEFEETKIIDHDNVNSVQQEFIYSGRNGDAIFFTYREFMGDLARPAFTQNVTYNLKEGKTIGFKGLKIDVFKANNTEVDFRLLSAFQ